MLAVAAVAAAVDIQKAAVASGVGAVTATENLRKSVQRAAC